MDQVGYGGAHEAAAGRGMRPQLTNSNRGGANIQDQQYRGEEEYMGQYQGDALGSPGRTAHYRAVSRSDAGWNAQHQGPYQASNP